MDRRQPRLYRTRTAFTMIELLVVIAIIAILAAILFPVFGAVREQARQSGTMSNMHAIYLGAKLFAEDEGYYPPVLFGYAETQDNSLTPPYRPAQPGDSITPMDLMKGTFRANIGQANEGVVRGYVYGETVKDFITFINSNDPVKDRTATTVAYYPPNSPMGAGSSISNGLLTNGVPVTWQNTQSGAGPNGCDIYGDRDLPSGAYVGQPKLFYKMDSMDIGPMIDPNTGAWVKVNGQPAYELHYSPDWSRLLGISCDSDANGARVTQLKYRNPPTDRTILTYNTHHAAVAGSSKVIVLLMNGTAKKMDVKKAFLTLPLNYSER